MSTAEKVAVAGALAVLVPVLLSLARLLGLTVALEDSLLLMVGVGVALGLPAALAVAEGEPSRLGLSDTLRVSEAELSVEGETAAEAVPVAVPLPLPPPVALAVGVPVAVPEVLPVALMVPEGEPAPSPPSEGLDVELGLTAATLAVACGEAEAVSVPEAQEEPLAPCASAALGEPCRLGVAACEKESEEVVLAHTV